MGMLTLADARKRRGKAVIEETGIKAWIMKNKGNLLIFGGAAVIVGGYFGYRYFFKKKSEVTSVASMGSPDMGLGSGGDIPSVDF